MTSLIAENVLVACCNAPSPAAAASAMAQEIANRAAAVLHTYSRWQNAKILITSPSLD
jgi:hypothetical protein